MRRVEFSDGFFSSSESDDQSGKNALPQEDSSGLKIDESQSLSDNASVRQDQVPGSSSRLRSG